MYIPIIRTTAAGGRPTPPPQYPRRIPLSQKKEVASAELIVLLDSGQVYILLGHDGKMVANHVDSRRAEGLATRRLIVGVVNGAGVLLSLKLAPGKTAAQVRNVMKLKPAAQSICNRATVVKVGETHWHVQCLGLLGQRRSIEAS